MSNKLGWYGPTSFAELEELVEAQEEAQRIMSLGASFSMLSDNIIYDDEVQDKAMALSNLVSEYTDRLSTSMVKEGSEGPSAGEASAERSRTPGEEPLGGATLKEAIMGLWSYVKGGPQPTPKSEGTSTGMALLKSKDDRWLWFARYSNKYLDNDFPREIISEESHISFAKAVREGREEYPELWLHHIKGTAWGKATWVGYDQGFAMAAGYVYPGFEEVATTLASKSNLLLSHGMAPESIVRDTENPHIILRHTTKEISPLPAHRAANKLTGFVVLEEDNMHDKGLSQEDREALHSMGFPEETIAVFDQANKTMAEIADKVKLPSKQAEVQQEPEPEVVLAQAENAEPEAAPSPVDEETVDAIVTSIQALGEQVKALANHVKALEETQDKMVGESTKAARMSILQSVIGSDAARIDGRSSLAKAGPAEPEQGQGGGFFFRQKGWTN